jgi:RNA polymerase sigma-70 factor (ECF subfamily)
VPELSEAEFGEFYRQTRRPLWVYVYRVTGNAADADDIVQEAFHRLLRAGISALSNEELRPYVFRIAGNLLADRWRRAARETSLLNRLREALTGTSAAPEQHAGLEHLFSRLTPRDRALLWLAYVEQHDHRRIAEALGLARGSVKVLLSRARARLRKLLLSAAAVKADG